MNRIVNAEGKENLRFFFSHGGSAVAPGVASAVAAVMTTSYLDGDNSAGPQQRARGSAVSMPRV